MIVTQYPSFSAIHLSYFLVEIMCALTIEILHRADGSTRQPEDSILVSLMPAFWSVTMKGLFSLRPDDILTLTRRTFRLGKFLLYSSNFGLQFCLLTKQNLMSRIWSRS